MKVASLLLVALASLAPLAAADIDGGKVIYCHTPSQVCPTVNEIVSNPQEVVHCIPWDFVAVAVRERTHIEIPEVRDLLP